jgi:hypothetical protein
MTAPASSVSTFSADSIQSSAVAATPLLGRRQLGRLQREVPRTAACRSCRRRLRALSLVLGPLGEVNHPAQLLRGLGVLEIQTKLHRWARDDPHRSFDDLFNLVADPAFLLVGWDRVRGNKGARTAGVDGATVSFIVEQVGVEKFLDALRTSVKDRSFRPLPVRERMIPKKRGRVRRLGIATITDRVVQASLKLVLEPIFEVRAGLLRSTRRLTARCRRQQEDGMKTGTVQGSAPKTLACGSTGWREPPWSMRNGAMPMVDR